MNPLIDLTQNIAMLLALTFVYSFVYPLLARFSRYVIDGINGLLFGSFAVIAMMQPILIAPGIFYDGRTVVIAIAGLYGGPIPALIAAVMVCLYRASLGGAGMYAGIGAALSAALLSIVVRNYLLRRGEWLPSKLHLFLAGIGLSLIGGLWSLIVFNFDPSVLVQLVPNTMVLYPLGMLLLGTLLTTQRRSHEVETALRASERRFRAVFDGSSQYISLLQPDGTLLETNQTTLQQGNFQIEAILGRKLWEIFPLIPAEAREDLRKMIERAAQGEIVRYEVDNWSPEGLVFDFTLTPIFDEQGRVVLIVPEGRDITQQKHYESQKLDLTLERERSTVLKKFIADISHDFRTPLSVIRLNLELLQRQNDPLQQERRIGVLLRETDRLTSLLDDMKMMLHLDDDVPLELMPISVNSLVQGVVETQQINAQAKKQSLNMDFAAADLIIEAASDELKRALSNLIVNAISYTAQGGTITVTTRKAQNFAEINVRDTGIGIEADDLPHIFQRFYRADQARSNHTGGTGLGLPISKKIIEAHGGVIEVESTPGTGSTFRVRLPLATEIAASAISEMM